MTIKFSRAQRRSDYARIKTNRQTHWGYGHNNWRGMAEMPKRQAGIVANTPAPCSCWMCRNPRHVSNQLTMQEQKAVIDYKDQLDDRIDEYEYEYEYYSEYYYEFESDIDWYLRFIYLKEG